MTTTRPRLLTSLAFCLLSGGLALADVPDLTGAWTIDEMPQYDGVQYPGSAIFTGKTEQGDVHGYRLALIQRNAQDAIETTRFVARWDGETLTLREDTSPNGSGAIDVLAGSGSSGASAQAPTATLEVYEPTDDRQSKLELDWLKRTANDLDTWIPGLLRRVVPAHDPQAMPEYLRPVRSPAEWEQAEEITWGAQDAFDVVSIYAEAIKATTQEDVIHRIYVVNQAAEAQVRYELAVRGIGGAHWDKAKLHVYNFRSVWIRDYGPLIVKGQTWNADGTALVDNTSGEVVDAEGRTEERFVVDTGYFPTRPIDDSLPGQYAKKRNWLVRNVESLKYEGGNFLTDGAGRMFTTTGTFEWGVNMKGSINRGQEHIEDRLRDLGAREVFFFERMPEPEGTGHIDMFAKLHDVDTVLVGSCRTPKAFKDVLDRNAARFAALGYEVIRLPMASGTKLMTYTNSLYVGNTVLVPVYNSSRDEPALQIYRDLGWNAVGIDARQVIKANGAIHCISMQIPK